jgi:hypothetical protein
LPPKRKRTAALISQSRRSGRDNTLLVRRLFFFCRCAAVTKHIDLEDTDAFIHRLHFYHPLGYWIDN